MRCFRPPQLAATDGPISSCYFPTREVSQRPAAAAGGYCEVFEGSFFAFTTPVLGGNGGSWSRQEQETAAVAAFSLRVSFDHPQFRGFVELFGLHL